MSAFTDARSQPGRKGASGPTERDLFLTEFGGMVIQAYDEQMDYDSLRYVKQITQGKADEFPIIGRKRDAAEHTPGEQILGGSIEHNSVTITVDNILVDAAFIAEIDELLNHYPLSEPYAKQLGQSLGSVDDKRIAIMHILASRQWQNVPQGQPVPAYVWDANMRTSGAAMENAAFLSKQYLLTNDISGDMPAVKLPWQQYLILSRFSGIEGGPVTTGSGNRSQGSVGLMAGLSISGSNHIPNVNITTGLAKYQGDFANTVGHCSSRMAVGSLERRAMRLVMKEQEDRLGTLLIASKLNGHGVLRPECSIEWRNNAIGGRTALS
jgi:hypothetical protein